MTKLEAWQAWCAGAGTEQLADQLTLMKSSHGKAFSYAWDAAAKAEREALAEQETVLPGGGHIPAVPVAVYGYCPECGGVGVMRERRPNGDDKCTNGHKYPSSKALAEQPAQPKRCQCPACKIAPHASDCPVHNEPAWPNGLCDCGAQPEQEPVAMYEDWYNPKSCGHCGMVGGHIKTCRHYTHPPQRTWVGLTDEEWQEIDASLNGKRDLARIFVRAIEAKLKEKNT